MKEQMNIVIVGHVDHGKSTVIGRLLSDTKSLPEGKLEQVKNMCKKESKEFEYAYLLDALHDEQDQGITIDSARVFFNTQKRNYIIIDAPGHIEFLKNMISGAARAEAALLVIDAKEGVMENSRRHAYMLSLLGIKQVSVIINKIDLVDYSQERYNSIVNEFTKFLKSIKINPMEFIPVSAKKGDNIYEISKKMPWYNKKTVLQSLDLFEKEPLPKEKPARMPLQGIYKFTKEGDSRRLFAGNITTGTFQVGDKIIFFPSGKTSTIESIEEFNLPTKSLVSAGYSTAFCLKEQVYVKRGEIMCKEKELSPCVSRELEASIFWLGKENLTMNKEYYIKIQTQKIPCKIKKINSVLNSSNLADKQSGKVVKNEVASCIIECKSPIAFDLAEKIQSTGRFVIVDKNNIAGGGIITSSIKDDMSELRDKVIIRDEKWVKGDVTFIERTERFAQKPTFILITGKSGQDKISLAKNLERELFRAGRNVYFLCIGNLLRGIDSDIKKKERKEHIRRLAEVGHLMMNAGQIVVATASDLSEEDLEVIKTVGENIVTISLDDNIKNDLYLEEEINTSTTKIITLLKEKGIIFKYD